MTIANLTPLEVLTVRIYKRIVTRPDIVWANTYELMVDGDAAGGDETQAAQAADALALWESRFHLQSVQFDRAVVSTLIPDGEPYNPATFVSYPLTGLLGVRAENTENRPQALQICLFARRVTNFGRNGRALYRRVLTETDVESPAGDAALTQAARLELQSLMGGAVGGAASLEEALSNLQMSQVLAYQDGTAPGSRRAVTSVRPEGVTIKAYNNRYFDRVIN